MDNKDENCRDTPVAAARPAREHRKAETRQGAVAPQREGDESPPSVQEDNVAYVDL